MLSKKYKFARPDIETIPWNSREVCIGDRFGNRIVFFENLQK
ncbi:glyoxalase superfamily protein [Metabacillus halosaccharovorans]|uniref:Glyoxalase superfamily protein n=1 Tax=Metabacillus halosaccharovorans TaxID=930124 RepID=A0ABT3DLQ3_9BACI|nr:glyoxalase superfamily protein [Metabacillus halosaccharovorans]MCV9887959.1 glyoxalase superfamily protein [Metabacillus halosaccharovorans]